jgi:hypothetical protein
MIRLSAARRHFDPADNARRRMTVTASPRRRHAAVAATVTPLS